MFIRLLENTQIQYYINSNKTILYIYNQEENKINKIFRDKFSTKRLMVSQEIKNIINDVEMDLQTIIDNDNDFIKIVEVISSTMKPMGFFSHIDNFGITSYYLNEFLGSDTFIKSKKQKKFKGKDTIELLREKNTYY